MDIFEINKAIDIYNNTPHSEIKIEPLKALYFKKKKILIKLLIILFNQIDFNKNSFEIQKGAKGLLCSNYILKGEILKEHKFKKNI